MANGAAEERRLVVVMFTDMVDYAARVQKDEALALQVLEEHNRLLRSVFAVHGGQEIKSTGDGFMLAFASALSAVRCAIEVQKLVVEYSASAPGERRFQVRIGLHLGDVVYRAADMVGDGVNIAARIEPLAEAGGICLSRPVYDQVHNKIEAALVPLGRPELKHIQAPVEVYRVVLPWQQASRPRRVPVPGALPGRRARGWAFGLAAAALAGLTYGVTHSGHRTGGLPAPAGGTARDPRPSIAVLPFENHSARKEDAYLSGGVTEQLSNTLAGVRGLRVVTVSSIPAGVPDDHGLGQRLNVASVLRGSVTRAGPQLRIMVRLETAGDGSTVWTESYDREFREILAIQSEVAQQVTRSLQVRLLPKEGTHLGKRPTVSVEAYEAYLRGRHLLTIPRLESARKAKALFEQAIRLDPQFAGAYSGLGDYYAVLADNVSPPRQVMEAARKSYRKALELDPTSAEAHTSLGRLRQMFDYDWHGAEQELRKAISLDPDYGPAHHEYGVWLVLRGRSGEALPELERAERLEPLSVMSTANVHLPYTYTGRYDQAIAHVEKAHDLDPSSGFPDFVLSSIYDMKGDYAKAIAHLKKAQSAGPDTMVLASLGEVYAHAGRTAEARRLLAEVKAESRRHWVSPAQFAWIQLALGDKEGALNSLEAAYESRSYWMNWLKIEPFYDPLRSDPRFIALIRKVGLAD